MRADTRPCAYVWWEWQVRPAHLLGPARARAYSHHMAVAASARRQRIGRALVAYVGDQAARRGSGDLALDVWAINPSAQAFYAALGFTPQRMVMIRAAG
ncbi:GNAT family N-acetyltransferase [Novosphingobium sp. FSY-8]|uniref:GNAT family N-acetyltransferase n=1 Tax=Novosphingobium ovatum TaxID=1908523 RepID=A0ABW9X9D7_9SPHN|nr:GNAT family N-acetyltransferase [Novosphingobium ovatum]NBC35141.1 GNAT family N-acetyltransferase [Novosphingobium ovatum]